MAAVPVGNICDLKKEKNLLLRLSSIFGDLLVVVSLCFDSPKSVSF